MKKLLALIIFLLIFVPHAIPSEFWISNKYYFPDYRWAQKIKPENLIKFNPPEEKVVMQSKENEEAGVQPPSPPEKKSTEVKKEAPVSFFFDDADIYEVIQTVFGEVLKLNYIVDPKVKGRVNFRTATPIPKDEVLPVMEIILRLNGIAVVEESGLYKIIPISNILKEPAPIRFGRNPGAVELKGVAIVQVVQLQYVTSTEIIKILTPLLSQGGSILDIAPNFLIIEDTDANVKRLLQVVETFDSEKLRLAKPQVFVYPVQNRKAKDIAATLQQIFLRYKTFRTDTTKTAKTCRGGKMKKIYLIFPTLTFLISESQQ
jgi:general secretion pathway protein D